MCSKKFTSKIKGKKIKKVKKPRQSPIVSIKPASTKRPSRDEPKQTIFTSVPIEKPLYENPVSDNLMSLSIGFMENKFESEYLSNISESYDQLPPIFDQNDPEQITDQHFDDKVIGINDQDLPQSQFGDIKCPYSSDLMEDEGMEPIFHKQYQKVECLDSPKMSNSSSKKCESLFKWRGYEDPFPADKEPAERTDMLSKMKSFCTVPNKLSSKFKLIPLINEQKPGEKLLLLSHETDLPLPSPYGDLHGNNSSTRKSRRNSRKNSSVENLNLA